MNQDDVPPIRTALDAVVADIKSELAAKDARIAELESQLAKLKPKPFEWKGPGWYRMRCGGVISVGSDGMHHFCSFLGLSFSTLTGRYHGNRESTIDLIEFIAPLA